MITYQSVHVDSDSETLTAKLHEFHDAILRDHTHIIRIACALYEEKTDYLKTFIHSTRDGHAITAYQAKLSEVPSLNALAEHQECRVIDNVQLEIKVSIASRNPGGMATAFSPLELSHQSRINSLPPYKPSGETFPLL